MRRVVLIVAWLLSACAAMPADTPDVAPLTDAQKDVCRRGGGCYTMTRAQLVKVIEDVARELAALQCADKT